MLLLLRLTHALELIIPRLRIWTEPLTLQQNEQNRTHDGYEVERQEHEVADDGVGRELRKRFAGQLPESADEVAGRGAFDLTFFGHELRVTACEERAVEGVDQAVFDEEGLAQDRCQGGALAQYKQSSADSSKRAGRESHNCHLRQVCEDEHEGRNPNAHSQCLWQLRDERLPQIAVGEEVEDALICHSAQVIGFRGGDCSL